MTLISPRVIWARRSSVFDGLGMVCKLVEQPNNTRWRSVNWGRRPGSKRLDNVLESDDLLPSSLEAEDHRHGAGVALSRSPRRRLLLIITYKAGDAFATGMLRPFLADAGLSLADIG